MLDNHFHKLYVYIYVINKYTIYCLDTCHINVVCVRIIPKCLRSDNIMPVYIHMT